MEEDMSLERKMGVTAHKTLEADHIQEFSLKNKGRPKMDFKSMWNTWGKGNDQIHILRPSG